MKHPLSKNDDIVLEITSMGSECQGVGRYEGLTVFVPYTIPGEIVEVHIIKAAANYAVGKLMRVLEESSYRVEPVCPVFGRCGGCDMQHISYAAQLDFKQQIVKDALERLGGFRGIAVNPTIGMQEPERYRNKGSFPFADTGEGAIWGLYAQRSHRLIPIHDCIIEQQGAIAVARTVCEWARQNSIPIYNEMSGTGILRHVITRVTDSGTAVTVVTTGALPARDALVRSLLAVNGAIKSIVHNKNPQNTNVITGSENIVIWGDATITQSICGMDFMVSAESFLQVNTNQTETLYALAANGLMLSSSDTVADLFCGIGTITLMLAKQCGNVIGIESVKKAVEDAKRNAEQNGIHNATFICGEAERALPELLNSGIQLTAITLDPPRKGAEPATLNAIIASGALRIAYVSCNPATLARDCRILADGGYAIDSVQPIDMFPMTHHVETVALLSRRCNNNEVV